MTDCPPFDKSVVPHISLLANPLVSSQKKIKFYRNVFDLRASNIDHFVSVISQIDFDFIYSDLLKLDDKCTLFHEILEYVFRLCIPVSVVICTPRDKPWITPLVKNLINKRWQAYRNRDYQLFNHMKEKVKKERKKSKLLWTKRMKSTDLWQAVHTNIGTKSNDPMQKLLMEFDTVQGGIEAVNTALSNVFLTSTSQRGATDKLSSNRTDICTSK